jgi:hypothetical protein
MYKAAPRQNKAESVTRNRPLYHDPEWVLAHLTHRIEIRFKSDQKIIKLLWLFFDKHIYSTALYL